MSLRSIGVMKVLCSARHHGVRDLVALVLDLLDPLGAPFEIGRVARPSPGRPGTPRPSFVPGARSGRRRTRRAGAASWTAAIYPKRGGGASPVARHSDMAKRSSSSCSSFWPAASSLTVIRGAAPFVDDVVDRDAHEPAAPVVDADRPRDRRGSWRCLGSAQRRVAAGQVLLEDLAAHAPVAARRSKRGCSVASRSAAAAPAPARGAGCRPPAARTTARRSRRARRAWRRRPARSACEVSSSARCCRFQTTSPRSAEAIAEREDSARRRRR